MRRLAAVLTLVSLGCASSRPVPPPVPMRSPRTEPVPPCGGLPGPSVGAQLALITVATILMGGVVAAGYFAIGGEAPAR